MLMEQLIALIVFIGLLAISLYGYWTSARRAEMLDRTRRNAPAPSQASVMRRTS